MSPLLDMQMRFRELGRIRPGEKGPKGEPKRRTTWRLTSASKRLLEVAQREYGGQLRPWENAPSEGYWELLTETAELDVMIPPVADVDTLMSQNYELWSGGGCKRRCDGVTQESGKPCACNPDERECKPKTRLSVMLPRVPDIGVWRIDSDGVNAALELPGTLSMLVRAANGNFLPASLRLEQRVSKKEGEPTRRFVVPVLEMPYADVGQLAQAAATGEPLLLASQYANGKPALPPVEASPDARALTAGEKPEHGERPPLPPTAPEPDPEPVPDDVAPVEPITPAQKKKLNVLVGKLRDAGHITTEQLYRRCQVEPVPGEDGEIHWSALRDSLSKVWASGLIEALSKLEERVSAEGSYDFEERAAAVQAAKVERERERA